MMFNTGEKAMLDQLLLVVFGFLIGILASMTGVGGGVFIVPILTFFYGFRVQNATGTSLTAIIFTALASTINYSKQKRIYFRTGLILAVTAAPGAYLGGIVAKMIEERLLGLIFGTFIILVAVRVIVGLIREKPKDKIGLVKSDKELARSGTIIIAGAFLSFFGGFASGLLGIGGGVLIVPIMTFALEMPIHYATATSMFTIIFTAISGSTEYYQSNLVNFPVALLFAVGTVVGAQVGAYSSGKISQRNLTLIFALILVVAGVNMILKFM
jgi:uncharacterized protein